MRPGWSEPEGEAVWLLLPLLLSPPPPAQRTPARRMAYRKRAGVSGRWCDAWCCYIGGECSLRMILCSEINRAGWLVSLCDVIAMSQWRCSGLTLGSVTQAGVCARLWFGSLSVQDLLDQLLNTEISRTNWTLHTVDWNAAKLHISTTKHTHSASTQCGKHMQLGVRAYTWASAGSAGRLGSSARCHGGRPPRKAMDCISQNPPGMARSGSGPARCLGSVAQKHTD